MAGLTLNTGGDFENAPADIHAGICVAVVDLGHQFNSRYNQWTHRVRIDFELPFSLMKSGDKPHLVSQEFPASLGVKAILRKVLETWRGQQWPKDIPEAFSLKNILGKSGMVQVVHNPGNDGGVWVNITNITPIPKNPVTKEPIFEMPKETFNKLRFIELTPEGFDPVVFDSLSDKTREKISRSQEFQQMFPGGLWQKGATPPKPLAEDEIPPAPADPESPAQDESIPEDDIPF